MTKRLLPSLPFILTALSLLAGCTGGPVPASPTEPPPTITSLPPTDTPTPIPPSATSTLPPTATPTTAPPTSTPTRTPLPITNTPKPTQPPPPTKAPATLPPPPPPSVPGVDVVAARGQETCVNKFVGVSFTWEEGPGDRKTYYWDKSWSVYPMYARPNIKLKTAKAICDKQNQCTGFTADYCVYVDGGAPVGGPYESILHLIIFSALPNGTGVHILTELDTKFTWMIK